MSSILDPNNKKRSDERRDAPQGPTKGTPERTLAAAPHIGNGVKALFWSFKSPEAQVGRFLRNSNLTLRVNTTCAYHRGYCTALVILSSTLIANLDT